VTHLPDEARLAVTLLLSAFVFVCSYRFAARTAPRRDWISNSFDAFLLTYLVQYLAVALPGIFGVLSAMTMCLLAIVLSVAMLVFPPLPLGEGRGEGLAKQRITPDPFLFAISTLRALTLALSQRGEGKQTAYRQIFGALFQDFACLT